MAVRGDVLCLRSIRSDGWVRFGGDRLPGDTGNVLWDRVGRDSLLHDEGDRRGCKEGHGMKKNKGLHKGESK